MPKMKEKKRFELTKSMAYYLSKKIRQMLEDFECVNVPSIDGLGRINPDTHKILINLFKHNNKDEVCETIIHELIHYIKPEWEEDEVEQATFILYEIKPLREDIYKTCFYIFEEFENLKGGYHE